MLDILIRVYRRWPLRPHCDGDRHVRLCAALGFSRGGSRCPAKGA